MGHGFGPGPHPSERRYGPLITRHLHKIGHYFPKILIKNCAFPHEKAFLTSPFALHLSGR